MWIIVKSYEREITLADSAETREEANEIIYDELLDIYDGDTIRMNEDIEDNEAEISDSGMFAWSNRKGNHDIKAFWV